MLLEALLDVNDENLGSKDREKAIEALIFAQTSLETSWKWKWTNPAKEWEKAAKKAAANASQNLSWISNHHLGFIPINSRFGWAYEGIRAKLVVLANGTPNPQAGPPVAIDYSDPNKIYDSRLSREIANSLIVFGTQFIPLTGFFVRYLYEKFVEGPTDRAKIWEARLIVALEELSAHSSTNHAAEISWLHHQNVNSLIADPAETSTLISFRRNLIGL